MVEGCSPTSQEATLSAAICGIPGLCHRPRWRRLALCRWRAQASSASWRRRRLRSWAARAEVSSRAADRAACAAVDGRALAASLAARRAARLGLGRGADDDPAEPADPDVGIGGEAAARSMRAPP